MTSRKAVLPQQNSMMDRQPVTCTQALSSVEAGLLHVHNRTCAASYTGYTLELISIVTSHRSILINVGSSSGSILLVLTKAMGGFRGPVSSPWENEKHTHQHIQRWCEIDDNSRLLNHGCVRHRKACKSPAEKHGVRDVTIGSKRPEEEVYEIHYLLRGEVNRLVPTQRASQQPVGNLCARKKILQLTTANGTSATGNPINYICALRWRFLCATLLLKAKCHRKININIFQN
ncbi:hypothetical protein EAG_07977 [Camponotus floridanus]|uniref:Uncharacterized protein n=1 Tax=Camponotus floridanus TaxID=104421 RepID=E2ACX2_CAMFO|nr:hypothetical protein EAG_07977 [Camponotus floridanus]